MRNAPIILTFLALVACAPRRTLSVTSEPADALVRLDDQAIGPTPQRIPFYHYGVRRVTLYKDGYGTHSERIELKPAWYQRFPMDLVSEVLLPIGLRDQRRLSVELQEGEHVMQLPTLQSVFERADILRRAGPEGPRDLPPPLVRQLERVPDPEEP